MGSGSPTHTSGSATGPRSRPPRLRPAAVFVALLEGIAADGLVLSGLTASAVVLVWAVTCLVYPASAGAVDGTWAAVAILVVARVRGGDAAGVPLVSQVKDLARCERS